ncbi:hypothetical protein I4F81_003130 [Pyropia yezoensis]|uniref:Uncharacterized protein n=1 Tax=Pyropia yezoensis TaxID=2788 RepID=A0ACC3BRR4_PYRYE|nr:hypothetical protein I4F81_003130 [Neopyropia yezoensis]
MKLPFQKLVEGTALDLDKDREFHSSAVDFLRQAAEDYLVEFFKEANLCALHARRITITVLRGMGVLVTVAAVRVVVKVMGFAAAALMPAQWPPWRVPS